MTEELKTCPKHLSKQSSHFIEYCLVRRNEGIEGHERQLQVRTSH